MALCVFFVNDVLFVKQVIAILTQVPPVLCTLWLSEYALVVLTHLFFYAAFRTRDQVAVWYVWLSLHTLFECVVVRFPRIATQHQLVIRLFHSIASYLLEVHLVHRDLCRAFDRLLDCSVVETASILQLRVLIRLSDHLSII